MKMMRRGPFPMPMYNDFVPQKLRPWLYLLCAFCFQMTGTMYGGNITRFMGETCLMREDVLMITLCGVVGLNMPFPFLWKMKFRFSNRQLLMNAAIVIAACNVLMTMTHCLPLLCAISYVAGFFKLCGTFECMSNIQLWITHKRDMRIFFPALYTFVVGNMSLTPWVSLQLAYIYQDWHMMNWLMAGVMVCVALFLFICTHPFRMMKPIPLYGVDLLGMLLWSAVMIEIIFLFNYGEFYNWWDGQTFRVMTAVTVLTLYLAVQRMRHIRHPYISPDAWKYKRLLPLLGLFALMELIGSTPKVLQNGFLGRALHYGSMQTDSLYLVEVYGAVCACTFIIFWVKMLQHKYTELLAIGTFAMFVYESMLYFMVTPGLDLYSLYIPVFFRAFGNAIFFTVLTIYLFDLMQVRHFFMGLTMVGMIRNGVLDTVCSGIYSFCLWHNITDNLSRGLPYDGLQSFLISTKQLYGLTSILTLAVLMVFLLWNIQPVRSTMKKFPYLHYVGRMLRQRVLQRDTSDV